MVANQRWLYIETLHNRELVFTDFLGHLVREVLCCRDRLYLICMSNYKNLVIILQRFQFASKHIIRLKVFQLAQVPNSFLFETVYPAFTFITALSRSSPQCFLSNNKLKHFPMFLRDRYSIFWYLKQVSVTSFYQKKYTIHCYSEPTSILNTAPDIVCPVNLTVSTNI